MRYILDVSGRDLELIKASIVHFERSLDISTQADFSHLTDQLNDEIATLEWQWFQREISDKDYVVAFDDIQRRIRLLEG